MAQGDNGAPQSDAAQALQTILQTSYLRYFLIFLWALGLTPFCGLTTSAIWMAATMAAGAVRGVVERQVARRVGQDYGLLFPLAAACAGMFWAAAPVLAWTSGEAFGRPAAMLYLACGYFLVATQLRNAPRQAIFVSSPYSVVAIGLVSTLWGRPEFWGFVACLPILFAVLSVHVIVSLAALARIKAFQDHQALLIQELEAARDRADAASKAKSAFLGVISHELRTPMNGVLGAAQLLSATRLDATQREYVSIVRNSGDNLLALLNDILDLTKIEADRMQLEAIDVDLRDLTARIGATWTARAREKDIDYAVDIAPDVPAVIAGDPTRLSQILHNLLSNAVKFTESGEVRLTLGAERLDEMRARLRFSVSDTGPGIAREDLERLFQPFTQLDVSSTRRFGGTGLGLAICRRLASLMRGDLLVDSRQGAGSTFSLIVEADVRAWITPSHTAPVTAEVESGRPLKVLVVEDHPVNRMILEAWLKSAGHETVCAENGLVGLEAAGTQGFDLILMDVNMPVMDGLAATRALRERDGPNRETPIVVLSASARAEDHQAGLAAGADAYLNKPIDFQALAGALGRVAHGGREAVAAMAA